MTYSLPFGLKRHSAAVGPPWLVDSRRSLTIQFARNRNREKHLIGQGLSHGHRCVSTLQPLEGSAKQQHSQTVSLLRLFTHQMGYAVSTNVSTCLAAAGPNPNPNPPPSFQARRNSTALTVAVVNNLKRCHYTC